MLQPIPKKDSRLPGIVVTSDMHEQLRLLSDATGISISELVRRSISLFLSKNANSISVDAN